MADITAIAARISSNTAVVNTFLNTKGLKQLSFDENADEEFPNTANEPKVEAARVALLEDTKTLHDLVLGPAEVIRRICWSAIDNAVQRVIYHFKLYDAIPLDGSASYAEIATKVGLSEHRVKSILRQSAMSRVFQEATPNRVTHTASSAVLLRDKAMLDWYGHCVEEMFLASAKLADAMEKYPGSEEPGDSAFSEAFGTRDSIFTFYEKHQARQARFFGAMAGVGKNPGHSLEHVIRGYDWNKLGNATVVDVGGSSGFVSICLAEAYPNLIFVVQDYTHTIEQGRSKLPRHLEDRVTFAAHNFFDPQPVTGDVYILRHICHNWSTKNSAKILRAIVPALKPTSRIFLVEVVMTPPKTLSDLEERYMRNVDMVMFQMLNAQERSAEDWQKVILEADVRLEILSIYTPTGSWDSIIEIGFKQF